MADDGMDAQIIRLLKADARRPYVDIARQLETSEGTVRARVKKLVDTGTIRGFTVRTAGRAVKALIETKIATNVRTSRISEQIATWPGIDAVWEVSGEDDILVMANVDNTGELNDIVERIRGFPEVASTKSRLILKEL